MKLLIVAIELGTGGLNRELPMNFNLLAMALGNPSQDLGFQLGLGRNATVEAESSQSRELDLNHIKPACGLGRVVEGEPLGQGKGLVSRQGFVEGTGVVRVQVVEHQAHLLGLRIGNGERLTEPRKFAFAALLMHLGQAATGQGFNGRQQRTGTELFISVMLLAHLPLLQGDALNDNYKWT